MRRVTLSEQYDNGIKENRQSFVKFGLTFLRLEWRKVQYQSSLLINKDIKILFLFIECNSFENQIRLDKMISRIYFA